MAQGTAGAEIDAEVAIVGCGPVGAMLANLLGLQGVRTLVLEREAAIYGLPRALHLDDEVMRLLQTVQLADPMQPLVHVSPGMKFVDDTGRVLLDWSRPMEIGPQAWYASYRFHQPDLERVLRDGFGRYPCVATQPSAEVFAIEQHPDHVLLRYEDLAKGRLRACRAQYVVGCDGARSLVRRLLGAPMEDLGFHERWLVVDAVLKRPRPDLGDYSIQHCRAARPVTYVRATGDRRRWEITVLADESAPAITDPARVFELLAPWVGPEDIAFERIALYTFHSAIASRWRDRRLLIAGDAAHLTPPFLGQGMCAGMRDVGNLAWKLARVLRGHAAEALLDTYETERAPHVREYIELAVRLGGLINTKAQAAAMAAAVPDATVQGGAAARMSSIKPRLGPGLAPDWDGPARQIAPQPMLADGTRLDDRVGYRFAAMLRPAFAATLPTSLLDRLGRSGIVVIADDGPAQAAWLDANEADAVLVRPDRYVLGAARSLPAFEALIAAAGLRPPPCTSTIAEE